jgi:hypothetical protein
VHCLGNSILFRAKTAFQNKAAKEIAPSGEPLSKKAIASTGETRVKNPTQKASKRVINPTPQGGRTQHAKSDFTKENTRRNSGYRRLLLELQTDGEGFPRKTAKTWFFQGETEYSSSESTTETTAKLPSIGVAKSQVSKSWNSKMQKLGSHRIKEVVNSSVSNPTPLGIAYFLKGEIGLDSFISKKSNVKTTFALRSLFLWMLFVAIPLSFFRLYVSRVTRTSDGMTTPVWNAPGIALLFLSLGLLSITVIFLFMIWKRQFRSAIAAVLLTFCVVLIGYPKMDAYFLSPPQGGVKAVTAQRNCDAAIVAAAACKTFYVRNLEWPTSWDALDSDLSMALVADYPTGYGSSRKIGSGLNDDPNQIAPLTIEEIRDCVDIDFAAEPMVLKMQKWDKFTGILPHKPSYNWYHSQFVELIEALSSSSQPNN